MKIKLLSLSAIAFSLTLMFNACKKDSSSTNTAGSQEEIAAQSDDQAQVSEEVDAVSDDADAAVSADVSTSGKILSICDATAVAEVTNDVKKITITYDGTNCHGNRKRTGVVVISMPVNSYWKDAGAVITISIQNLKITRVRDNKSITINGTKTITNVTGGLLKDLASRDAIVHTINSEGITVTFDNNKQRSWQLAIKRTFSYDNGIVVVEEGTHTDGATTGIAVWGTNRFGNAFSWAIAGIDPLTVRQDCNFRLVSGTAIHTGAWGVATATFGLDAAGIATTCPAGDFYFKTVFVGNG
ncbi:MAG: hypothetical protein ABUT20_62435, partial [Bacteroidota bacterium]